MTAETAALRDGGGLVFRLNGNADGVRDESCRQRFALHFVLLLTSASPADFAHAAATDKDVRMIEAGGRFAATLSDAEWPADLS